LSKIAPQIPKGFRDILPSQMVIRQQIVDTIRRVFELFGFEPIETPALEYASILEGKYGEEGEKLIYKFEDRGGRQVALRYDLTIPLSRVTAMYPSLPKPLKCYHIAPVWRADKPQKGRFREFWQCDADIVGTTSMLADAEVIASIYHVLKALNFKQFTIRINNRKLLNGIAQASGIEGSDIPQLLRIIDKREQKGVEGIKEEMREKGFKENSSNKILELLSTSNGNSIDLSTIKNRFSDTDLVREGVKELEEIFIYLASMGVDTQCYRFDFSLARGLDYYTGPIFETTVEEPKIGSITGGGRYDTLIGMFSDSELPATGSSFGLERIITVMEELKLTPTQGTIAQILVTLFSPELYNDSLKIATELRSHGLSTEVYLKHDNLKKQFSYASIKGIPLVIIIGPDEQKQHTVMVRTMTKGTQTTVAVNELIDIVRRELNSSCSMRDL